MEMIIMKYSFHEFPNDADSLAICCLYKIEKLSFEKEQVL